MVPSHTTSPGRSRSVKGRDRLAPPAIESLSQRRVRHENEVQVIRIRDLSRSLPIALMRAREAVMQYFRPHHRRHGITEQQWRVLRVLYKEGELEPAELARKSVLMRSSLSRIVRDLRAAGMVTRTTVAGDLRRRRVAIGPAGLKLLTRMASLSEASFAEITRRLGKHRLNRLFKLLHEIEKMLERPGHFENNRSKRRRSGSSGGQSA